MSDQSVELVHEFTYHAAVSFPHEVGMGPYGRRQYYEVKEGVFEGPRFNGKLLGPGSDWMLVASDGFIRMDVRIQMETDDRAIICAHYFGPAEVNQKLGQAVAASAPTEFSDQLIRSHWLLETGDARYAWVNQSVFVGEGRLHPFSPGVLGFEHRVYRLG